MVEATDGPVELASLAAEVAGAGATVTREGAGWDHVAWRVTGGDGRAWILRRAVSEESEDPSAEVRREVGVMHAARAVLGELVADAVVVDGAGGWMAYPRMPGTPLQELLAAGTAPDAALGRLAGEVGAVIRALAELTPPPGVPVEEGLDAWLGEVPDSVDQVEHLLDSSVCAAIDRFLATSRPADPDPAELRFGHNDLGAEHVLVDPTTFAITGIIDWSDAAVADQAADVGRLLRDLGSGHVDAVLDGMQLAAPQRARVLERAWCYARCLGLEDLAYAITNRPDLVEHELATVARLFHAV